MLLRLLFLMLLLLLLLLFLYEFFLAVAVPVVVFDYIPSSKYPSICLSVCQSSSKEVWKEVSSYKRGLWEQCTLRSRYGSFSIFNSPGSNSVSVYYYNYELLLIWRMKN